MLTIPGNKGNANQNHTKIPPHSCYNSWHQEQQMLARMWGKSDTHMLLVGMQATTTTMENNMKSPLKTKHRSAI
jgi:hypothetical protein